MADLYNPSNTSVVSNHAQFRSSSKFAQNFVFDRPIKEIFQFQNFSDEAPANMASFGAGAAELAEINSSEICGITLTTTDSHSVLWTLPPDIDLTGAIDFRVLWSESGGGAGTATFTGTYKAITIDTTAIAVAATALDTVFTAQNSHGANVVGWTPWGSISASKTGVVTLIPGQDLLVTKFLVTLVTLADCTIYAGQVRYYRKWLN